MLRRHAFGFRTLLMLADAVLAIALLVEQPVVFAVANAGAWVAVLRFNGLYRPRARWTIRSEGLAVARATIALALITLRSPRSSAARRFCLTRMTSARSRASSRGVTSDEGLREFLRGRGRARSGELSWDRTARTFRALYRSVAGFALSDEDRGLLAAPTLV